MYEIAGGDTSLYGLHGDVSPARAWFCHLCPKQKKLPALNRVYSFMLVSPKLGLNLS